MISNNPYNSPDVPMSKPNRIYQDLKTGLYRQDSFDNIGSPRPTHHRLMGRNSSFKGEEVTYQNGYNSPLKTLAASTRGTAPHFYTSKVSMSDQNMNASNSALQMLS